MAADMWRQADVVIVGGGPVGCVTALCLTQKGARVTLIEAGGGEARRRFSGEWIHPPGVSVLTRLGLTEQLEHSSGARGLGFLIYRHPDAHPLRLAYPEGDSGLCCEHDKLVSTIRHRILQEPAISYLEKTRAISIDDSSVLLSDGSRIGYSYLIGADGRESLVRRTLYGSPGLDVLSLTVGLRLDVTELPQEGFGHIIAGTHGPVLIYRISPGTVRICFDLPLDIGKLVRRCPQYLWEICHQDVPVFLKEAFRFALRAGTIIYGANHRSRQLAHGSGQRVLVGDAAGVTHPLTASGLTRGFKDAELLAESHSCHAFRLRRVPERAVSMILGTTLHRVFTDTSHSGEPVRDSMFDLLDDKAYSAGTMRLLAGSEKNFVALLSGIFAVYMNAVMYTLLSPTGASFTDRLHGSLSVAYGFWVNFRTDLCYIRASVASKIWNFLLVSRA